MSQFNLDYTGKTIIVTGAAGGLGLALAQAFYANNANVVITDVNDDRLASAPEHFAAANREKRFLAVKADSSDETEVDELIKRTVEKFGSLDVLVNNAAVNDDMEPTGDVGRKMWDMNIKVNLTAPYVTSKAAINEFLKKDADKKGVILNVVSAAGMHGYRAGAAYTASKHGLIGLTRSTAAYYAQKGIRCVAILPGAMQTNMAQEHGNRKYHEEGVKLVSTTFAAGMNWNPLPEVAKTVLCLCSDDMHTVSGSLVACDSGWTAM